MSRRKACQVRLVICTTLWSLAAFCALPMEAWSGETGPLPPEVAASVRASGGQLAVRNFVPAGPKGESIDLEGYYPLEPGSWWAFTGYQLNSAGWDLHETSSNVTGTQDMGGGVIASGVTDGSGVIQWMGWSPTGLLLFAEEQPDSWSSIYRIPLYLTYDSMDVGSTCSGDTFVDLFNEPEHSYYATGKRIVSYTLLGVADVTLPLGDFLDSAIFSIESIWGAPGEFEYQVGLMVFAPGVGPIFSRMLYVWSEGVVDWGYFISILSDYSIPPP